MPDEKAQDTTRSDAPSIEDSLFGGKTADDTPAVAVEEQGADKETAQDPQGSADAEGEKAQEPEGSDAAGNASEEAEGLKVVVSIKGSRAIIGVQQPSSDPHIESFDDVDESALAQEVPAVIERARARWEESPKHPTYERPAPPPKRRNRRQQGAAQDANAETETDQAQQALKLF